MIRVSLNSIDRAAAETRVKATALDQVAVAAVNEVASEVRQKELIPEFSSKTGVPRRTLGARIEVRRATVGNPVAEIRASGAGIPAKLFRFRAEATAEPTRARVVVDWVVSGSKVAAGFINPRGKARTPLRTYSSKEDKRRATTRYYRIKAGKSAQKVDDLDDALAPSTATMIQHKVAADRGFLDRIQTHVARVFAARITQRKP
ncbi:phage tail protein [Chitinimonas lacunae]|uniref:Phage tail protein n=1 Tax=Chitinimonas lacunae TaxID=1963018 RepID=A0ABV8MUF7_9NEIS